MQYEGSSRADATKSLIHFTCALGILDEVLDAYGQRRGVQISWCCGFQGPGGCAFLLTHYATQSRFKWG